MTNPTPDELSQWITENIMGECWHKWSTKNASVKCLKCGSIENNHSYAIDLNLAMKAVEKIPRHLALRRNWETGEFTAYLGGAYQVGDMNGAYAICRVIMRTWEAREEKS